MKNVLTVVLALLGAFMALEKWYHHPTYGNGAFALIAALQAGELF